MEFSSIWSDLRGVSFEQGWIDADGTLTRYLASGDADLPPLILLHGTGGHAEAYVRNLAAHGQQFRTYAIDMIGHGWTDKPDQPMEISAYVRHLRAFLDAIGADRAHISGESLGGWVAARFALTHPDRVDKLVLNTTGGSTARPEVMEKIRDLTMRAVQNPSWDTIRVRLEWLMADPNVVTPDLIATRQAIYSAPGYVETMKRILVLQEMAGRQRNLLLDADWAAISAETLVLWTTHDPTNPPKEGRRIAELIPNANYRMMTDCGHWPQFENAPEFDRIHLAFLVGGGNALDR